MEKERRAGVRKNPDEADRDTSSRARTVKEPETEKEPETQAAEIQSQETVAEEKSE